MKCIICDNDNLENYADTSYMRLAIKYCKQCNTYITGSSEDEVRERSKEIYKKEYWDGRFSELAIKSNYTDIHSQGKYRQWISQIAYCEPYLKNHPKILEIGSGPGQALFWFKERGFDITGLEPDERNAQMINQKLEKEICHVGFAEEMQIQGKFDIIWISHVFEHLFRPDTFLKKCLEKLNDKGIIFIEVPNCINSEILESSVEKQPSTYHFSKESLIHLAKKCGYSVLKSDILRSATKQEGATNKILKKFGIRKYPYYPKILTDSITGTDVRIILQAN